MDDGDEFMSMNDREEMEGGVPPGTPIIVLTKPMAKPVDHDKTLELSR